MRTLRNNMRPFWYAKYTETQENANPAETNAYGEPIYSGEPTVMHGNPIRAMGNISPAGGAVGQEMFGTLEGYDRIILPANENLPVDENSVIWIDRSPAKGEYDYIVKRIARGLNTTLIAVKKVSVSV